MATSISACRAMLDGITVEKSQKRHLKMGEAEWNRENLLRLWLLPNG